MERELNGIRRLSMHDLDRAIVIMSRAFRDDPLWQYLIPDVGKRERLLPRFFPPLLKLGIRSGQAYGASDPIAGLAIWTLPGEQTNPLEFIRAGFVNLVFSPLAGPIFRASSILGRFDVMQKQYAPEPHVYLNTIGVLPDAQGNGLASKLIRPFLAQADAQGMSAYTETMTPSNVPLYEHYGYRCMEQYRVPGTTLSIWALKRPARQ